MLTTSAATTAALVVAENGDRWGPGFGWLFFLIPLFWIGLFALIFALVGRSWRRAAMRGGYGYGAPWAQSRSAESTLAQRYANGDIDEVEYRARLEVLRANRPNAG